MTSAVVATPARRSRRRRTRILLAAGAAVVAGAIALSLAASGGPSSASASVAVRAAPPFRLPAVTGSGSAVTLAAAAGQPVVLSFFASWCDGCRQEMATMGRVAQLTDRVRVIGVDVNDSTGPARTLLQRDHIRYPVGADATGAVASAYRLDGLPTTVFLDARHQIVGESVGPLSQPEAKRWVDRLAGTGGS
jgi:cytochrome c biogenesis protein CcmG/thiol:disulfide interchange protein DsbE